MSSSTDAVGAPRPAGVGADLVASDLHTWFRTPNGPARAVDGVSMRIEAGRTLGVVGESGSGKTMLARSIMGLLPWRSLERVSGTVRYRGVEVRRGDEEAVRKLWGREMAMVFQNPLTSLNPVVPVGRQIGESITHHLGLGRHEVRRRVVDLLESVGMPEPQRQVAAYPHELSGGMRQRVVIAIALACGPGLLIADEPTTALDVTVQRQILDLLDEQRRERNMAMLLITHDLGVVAGRADDVAVMYAGQIVELAPARALFGSPRHPYTEALLASIPALDTSSHERLAAIAGRPPDLIERQTGCRFAPRCRYARDDCLSGELDLAEVGSDPIGAHVRCLHPVGTSSGDEALAANRRLGRSATGVPVDLIATPGTEAG